MRISLLARDDQAPTTMLLRKSAHRLGLELRVLQVEKLHFKSTDSGVRIFQENDEVLVEPNEWLWPRLGSLTREQGLAAIETLGAAGMRLVTSKDALQRASDKVESIAFLKQEGFRVPESWAFQAWTRLKTSDLSEAPRYWIKNRIGSQGIGVSWADSKEHALAQVDLIRMNQGSGLIQAHVEGVEVRALVWRDEVLGAACKTKSIENPRGNAHQGSVSQVFKLTSEQEKLCIRAAKALQLQIAGVDFILPASGDLVLLEVNPSPGFSDLTAVTKSDFATRILQDLAKS